MDFPQPPSISTDFYRLPSISPDIPLLPSICTDFHRLSKRNRTKSMSLSQHPLISLSFHRASSASADFRRLASTSIDFTRIPSISTGFHQLSPTYTESDRFPLNFRRFPGKFHRFSPIFIETDFQQLPSSVHSPQLPSTSTDLLKSHRIPLTYITSHRNPPTSIDYPSNSSYFHQTFIEIDRFPLVSIGAHRYSPTYTSISIDF